MAEYLLRITTSGNPPAPYELEALVGDAVNARSEKLPMPFSVERVETLDDDALEATWEGLDGDE